MTIAETLIDANCPNEILGAAYLLALDNPNEPIHRIVKLAAHRSKERDTSYVKNGASDLSCRIITDVAGCRVPEKYSKSAKRHSAELAVTLPARTAIDLDVAESAVSRTVARATVARQLLGDTIADDLCDGYSVTAAAERHSVSRSTLRKRVLAVRAEVSLIGKK